MTNMASLIPGYEYDIFISYRRKDNRHDGWVTEFVQNLKGELEATFKEDISVYFDNNPNDGLLETHDVDASLKDKLKCLVFIPVISRTYCDPKSFAWEHEFKAFVEQASQDPFGLKVKLPYKNVANRVLPVSIHDLDNDDMKLCESVLNGVLRGVEFIYKEPGVNRPLRSNEDNPHDNLNHTIYYNQINKVALAVRDIIESMKGSVTPDQEKDVEIQIKQSKENKKLLIDKPVVEERRKSKRKILIRETKLDKEKIIFRAILALAVISILVILSLSSFKLYKKQYARNRLIPEIQKLVQNNFFAPSYAFELATEAEKYIPDDSVLIGLWPKVGYRSSLKTQPEGASVFWKDYNKPKDTWKNLGITPLQNYMMPVSYIRMKIEKSGFQTVYLTNHGFYLPNPDTILKLDSTGVLPENTVRVPSQIAPMINMGRVKYAGKMVGEFLVDRFEVTNKGYKNFLDAGGYTKRNYWKYPIYSREKEISWDSAMNIFVDKTGKQGPAGWEVGNYPKGEENYPVGGISWYEASAYSAFEGKELPTIYHWSVIAETSRSMNIIPLSNFNGKSPVPVGSMEGMSSYGIYDLAGNVREWCYNGNGIYGENYIVGGGWNDPVYSFNGAGTQPSLDRSLSNGFRCIKELPGDTTLNYLSDIVAQPFDEYYKEKPVDYKTFKIFLRQYAYDKIPLAAHVENMADSGIWKIEKVTLDVGYNKERMDVYLYIPKDVQPPYQPVIYFPGSGSIYLNKFQIYEKRLLDFIVESGRVLVYPIYKGTFERKDELSSDLQEETVFYKDHVIMWRKDIGRTIDYLETRDDILSDKVGYFGWSWGGFMGGLIPAVEKRIKAIVLHVGGMDRNKALPEADQLNFLPRVIQPVLMLNGKYDMFFPVETSQMPMFNLLGTPEKDKKILIYDTGHLVPRTELIKETLAWFDKYLGPVK